MKTLQRDATVPDAFWPRFGEPAKLLPVCFILSVISALWYIYAFHHCVPMIRKSETQRLGCIEVSIVNFLTVAIFTCYARSICTHPGTVPNQDTEEGKAWARPTQDVRRTGKEACINVDQQEKKKSGERRTCKWCDKLKPDRAHHCRVCRTCILKMDHHCPWIYNCVGFRNHKYFLLLVMYVVLCLHFIVWTMYGSIRKATADELTPFWHLLVLLVGEVVAALFAVVFSTFFVFHVYLMLQNMTTIEFCEKKMTGSHRSAVAFDRGLLGNIKASLGDNVLFWFLPLSPPPGNGLSFSNEEAPLCISAQRPKAVEHPPILDTDFSLDTTL